MDFNLQLFGNNDTVTSGHNLYMGLTQADDKVQYFKIQSPSYNLTEYDVKDFLTYAISGNFLIDESTGTPFSDTSVIFTAYTETKETRNFDIS